MLTNFWFYLVFRLSIANLVFLILLLLVLVFIFYQKNRYFKKKLSKSFLYQPDNLKEELNPDINTLNWDLHKNRLKRFGRSQYKGLTFFINEQGKIYYLSEEGNEVNC